MTTVLFRADADDHRGAGHVMRCVALGMRLKDVGYDVHFVAAELPMSICKWLQDSGIGLSILDVGTQWSVERDAAGTNQIIDSLRDVVVVVVDHYDLDSSWEVAVSRPLQRIWAIDDLADRPHCVDALIDPGLHADANRRYVDLLPVGTVTLLGPQFALLRPEFDTVSRSVERDGHVRSLLLYLGGGLLIHVEIEKVLRAIEAAKMTFVPTTLLIGPLEGAAELHRSIKASYPWVEVHETSRSVGELMARADLAIGSCGASNWERCSMGLPTLTVLTAENQRDDAEQLHQLGAVRHLGDAREVTEADWVAALEWAVSHPLTLRQMGERCRQLVPGWREVWPTIERLLPDVG